MTSLLVITAGLGSPSTTRMLGERLARATAAASETPLAVRHLELRELAVDLAHHQLTRIPSPALAEAFEAVRSAAGVVAVTPVFNGSYSGLFKLFFDSLDEGALAGRPVLLGATGGTARHSLVIDQAMLPLFYYLKAVVAPSGVFAATEEWGSDQTRLPLRIERAGREFAGLIAGRSEPVVTDEFAVPDFETLLRS